MITSLAHSIPYKNVSILLVWGFSALFYFYENLLQVLPSVMKPELSNAFDLSGTEYGNLTAVCFYAYGLMQIPVGILIDRFKPKYTLSFACLLCALGCFIFAFTKTLLIAKTGRIFMGIGGSFAFISTVKLVTDYFPFRWNAFLLGLTVTVGFLGSAVGLSWVSQFTLIFDWRSIMLGCGLIGLALSFVLFVFLSRSHIFSKSEFYTHKIKSDTHFIIRKEVWVAGIYSCFMFIPTQVFGASWGIPFLCEAHGFEHSAAGMHIALIYLGWMVGAPFWGWLSSSYEKNFTIMRYVTFITIVLSLIIIFYNPTSSGLVSALLFGLGLFSSAYLLIFSSIQSIVPLQFSGTVFGVMNAICSLSAFADPLVGKILDRLSLGRELGQYLFTLLEYQSALLIVPFFLLISLVLLFFIVPRAYFLENRVRV